MTALALTWLTVVAIDFLAIRWARREPSHDLRQTLPDTPLVFLEEHRPELGELLGRIVEDGEDHFPILDRETEDPALPLLRSLEGFGGVVEPCVSEPAGELEDVSVGDGNAGQHHSSSVHVFVSGDQWPKGTCR